jgi:hypothetical protein
VREKRLFKRISLQAATCMYSRCLVEMLTRARLKSEGRFYPEARRGVQGRIMERWCGFTGSLELQVSYD